MMDAVASNPPDVSGLIENVCPTPVMVFLVSEQLSSMKRFRDPDFCHVVALPVPKDLTALCLQ